MARYEFVKGLPVVSMAEGKQIGKIDELVVDPERKMVGWLRLHRGGMGPLGGERLWVSTEAVHGVGEDAVTINAEADSRTPEEPAAALAVIQAKRGVIGSKVMTENGEHLGEVRDYEFDSSTFALTSLSVPSSMNAIGDALTIAGNQVLTIGEGLILVASDVPRRAATTEAEDSLAA